MSIEATVENFISNELLFGQSRTQIDPDQDLISSGLLDSVDILRLVLFIEEQFVVRVEDGEVLPDYFRTINLIKSFVQAKQGAGQPASSDVQGRNINTNSGLTAGATLTYNFSSMIGIQLEPAYTEAGASIYSAQTDEGFILEIDQTIEMSYIAVPILIKVSFPGDFITPYLLGGANIGFPLDDTKVRIDKVIANGEDVTSIIPSELIDQELN